MITKRLASIQEVTAMERRERKKQKAALKRQRRALRKQDKES